MEKKAKQKIKNLIYQINDHNYANNILDDQKNTNVE